MIHILPGWLREAVAWINRRYPDDEDVNLVIVHGYDAIEFEDGQEVKAEFAVHDTKTKTIYMVDSQTIQKKFGFSEKTARAEIIRLLLREYRHHQRAGEYLPINEREAEDFAQVMYKEYEAERKNWITPIAPGRIFKGPKGELIIKSLELDDEQKLEPKGERKNTNED